MKTREITMRRLTGVAIMIVCVLAAACGDPAAIAVNDEAASLDSEFAINRKDFSILYPGKPDDLIRDEVVIKLSIKAARNRG